MSSNTEGRSRWSTDMLEETLIALLLGFMTLITFANVIARYVFNDNILWALESTVHCFAWLVLLGACYGVKKSLHLGIDILVVRLSMPFRKAFGLIAVAACLTYSILLLKGGWDYWYPFVTTRAFMEVNDIPLPGFLQFLSVLFNDGEAYEKFPRLIPYAVLPMSMALLTWRFLQAGLRIYCGETSTLIASHEAEEALENLRTQNQAES
jgi:C4-dicarboxylate transporter DctQ subunit